MNKVLVCTGFHRSATSATSHLLHRAGLNMGNELMIGNISNTNGHFEDWPVVRLHDEQLAKNETNWQLQNTPHLRVEQGFLNEYIATRNSKENHWGVKDPRACLFLEEWNRALGSQGQFLFVARHWTSCIESLLHRHSRDFAYQLPHFNRNAAAFQFWIEPELAANMWLAYNHRILTFTQLNPDKVLLASQKALFNNAPVIQRLNERFGFNLDSNVQSPFDKRLLNESSAESISTNLSSSLRYKLDSMWEKLLALAEFKASDESPLLYSISSLPSNFAISLEKKLQTHVEKSFEKRGEEIPYSFELPSNTDKKYILSWLKTLPPSYVDVNTSQKIKTFIECNLPTDSSLWLQFGLLNFRANLFKQSISALKMTIVLGEYYPYMSMYLAQCYQNLNNESKAEYFFDKAINDNPNNPIFYTSKAQYFLGRSDRVQAENCLNMGIDKIGFVQQLVIKLATLYLTSNEINKAEELLKQSTDQTNLVVATLLTQVKLQKEVELGIKDYNQKISAQLAGKDCIDWLASHSLLIKNAHSERDFIYRCFSHWEKLDSLKVNLAQT